MPERAAVRLGTRGSTLATTQSRWVADRLGLPVELVRIRTEGDVRTGSLASLGGAGVFVAALREAVLDGRCDLAVHSLKDLPTAAAPGLAVVAVPEREDPRDALIGADGATLATLPDGARVGTGSPRRAAQLRAARPDLDVVDIRGNVETRLGRVPGTGPDGATTGPGDLDAVVLAAAGLARIGRLAVVTELLDPAVVAPAPGQGALAVECRADGDPDLLAAVAAVDHLPSRLAVTAERAVLATLEAGCAAPVGAYARVEPADTPDGAEGARGDDAGDRGARLVLDAVVCALDGTRRLTASATLPVPTPLAHAAPTPAPTPTPTGDFSERTGGSTADLLRELVRDAESLGVDVARRLLADGAAALAPLRDAGLPPTEPGP